MFESIKKFFKSMGKKEEKAPNSKEAAKERLHLVLMQDRANVSADFLELMKQEIIDVIKKYIDIDEKAIDVRLTNKENEDGTNGAPALYANIPIINIKNEVRKMEKEDKNVDVQKKDENVKDIEKDEKNEDDKKEDKENKENQEQKEIDNKEKIEEKSTNDVEQLKENSEEDKNIDREIEKDNKENKNETFQEVKKQNNSQRKNGKSKNKGKQKK